MKISILITLLIISTTLPNYSQSQKYGLLIQDRKEKGVWLFPKNITRYILLISIQADKKEYEELQDLHPKEDRKYKEFITQDTVIIEPPQPNKTPTFCWLYENNKTLIPFYIDAGNCNVHYSAWSHGNIIGPILFIFWSKEKTKCPNEEDFHNTYIKYKPEYTLLPYILYKRR